MFVSSSCYLKLSHKHYHESSDCFKYPKKSLLKLRHPKNCLPNLLTQKNPGLESFKPQKILQSSLSLEIWSAPPQLPSPPPQAIHYTPYLVPDIDNIFCRISIVSVPPHFNQTGRSITDKELIPFKLQPTLSIRRKAREAYPSNGLLTSQIEAKLFHQTI